MVWSSSIEREQSRARPLAVFGTLKRERRAQRARLSLISSFALRSGRLALGDVMGGGGFYIVGAHHRITLSQRPDNVFDVVELLAIVPFGVFLALPEAQR